MYDSDVSTVIRALSSSSPVVFSNKTIANILALTTTENDRVRFHSATPDVNGNVTVAAGAEVVFINSSDTFQTTVASASDAPVLIFQGKGGVVASIGDGNNTPSSASGGIDRMVVGSSGNDSFVITDAKNTQVVLGTGNSTVVAGAGNDTIVAGLGNSTIVGSGRADIVQLTGNASDYSVQVGAGGDVTVTGTNTNGVSTQTNISAIQYVQLDNGKALIFAKDPVEAAVSTLYQTMFGRTADAGGLDFWFAVAKSGATIDQIASAFINSAEYQVTQAGKSDEQFITGLYLQTFNREAEAAGLEFWKHELEAGATRDQLSAAFAKIAVASISGGENVEPTVVGSVTIVHNII